MRVSAGKTLRFHHRRRRSSSGGGGIFYWCLWLLAMVVIVPAVLVWWIFKYSTLGCIYLARTVHQRLNSSARPGGWPR